MIRRGKEGSGAPYYRVGRRHGEQQVTERATFSLQGTKCPWDNRVGAVSSLQVFINKATSFLNCHFLGNAYIMMQGPSSQFVLRVTNGNDFAYKSNLSKSIRGTKTS